MATQTINRLSILQMGKLLGVIYGMLAVVFLPFALMSTVLSSGRGGVEGGGFMLFMLLLYPVMGFIGGIIGAAVYNLASRLVGGIEIELSGVGR